MALPPSAEPSQLLRCHELRIAAQEVLHSRLLGFEAGAGLTLAKGAHSKVMAAKLPLGMVLSRKLNGRLTTDYTPYLYFKPSP